MSSPIKGYSSDSEIVFLDVPPAELTELPIVGVNPGEQPLDEKNYGLPPIVAFRVEKYTP